MDRLGILVVEDSSVCAAAIKLAVSNADGWQVIGSAPDAETALEMCGRLAPDVMTLDLNMPGGGGLEMLSTIKQRCDVPIVVVSASTYEGSPVNAEALACGADAWFDKSRLLVDSAAFVRTLRQSVSDAL